MAGSLKQTIEKVGDFGKLTVVDLLPLPDWAIILFAAILSDLFQRPRRLIAQKLRTDPCRDCLVIRRRHAQAAA